jgi:hypothetical protein
MLVSNDDIDVSNENKTSQAEDHPNEVTDEKDRKDRQNFENCSNGIPNMVDQIEDAIPDVTSNAKMSSIIYLSRGLSAWGDRLWAFGIGIFMNLMGPKNLRLVRACL